MDRKTHIYLIELRSMLQVFEKSYRKEGVSLIPDELYDKLEKDYAYLIKDYKHQITPDMLTREQVRALALAHQRQA